MIERATDVTVAQESLKHAAFLERAAGTSLLGGYRKTAKIKVRTEYRQTMLAARPDAYVSRRLCNGGKVIAFAE